MEDGSIAIEAHGFASGAAILHHTLNLMVVFFNFNE